MANVRCEFYYEADGFDTRQARLLDAEMNIRDGNGSSKDFARYCRESGVTKVDALARGWFEKRQGNGVRVGIYGSENLYNAFVNDKIGEVVAAKIAQAAPGNDALQRAGLREVIENGKSADYAVAVMQAAAVNAGQTSGEVQLDLFGADDSALNEARHMAEYAMRKKRALHKLIRASQGAINDPKAFAQVTKTKVKDAEDAAGRLAKMAAEARRWENFAVHSELAAEARAWDGKAAVEVEVDKLPDAVELPSYAMELNVGKRVSAAWHAVEDGSPVEIDGSSVYVPDIKQARVKVREAYRQLQEKTRTNGYAFTMSDGRRVGVSGKGFKEIMSHGADRRNLAALLELPLLASSSRFLYSSNNMDRVRKPDIVRFHYYLAKGRFPGFSDFEQNILGKFQGDQEMDAYVILSVSEYKSGELIYDLSAQGVGGIATIRDASQNLPDTRISNPGPTEGASRITRIQEIKKYVNYIDSSSTEDEKASYSMRWLGGGMVQDALMPERANAAVTYLVDDMVKSVNKIGELGNTLRLDAENDRSSISMPCTT